MDSKTITFQRARKVVECSNGAPECETDKLKFEVIRQPRGDDGPGVITISYNPTSLANNILLKKVSGPSTDVKKGAGPIPCALCNDLTLSTGRTKAMDALLQPDLVNRSDQEFLNERGITKEAFLQSDMNWSCGEYMGGEGLNLFYQAARFNINCNAPQIMKTGSLKATVTASMQIYWFSSNCVKSQKTITSTKSFKITSKQFSIATLKGGQVRNIGSAGRAKRYGAWEYDCPNMEADLFCGTCFYELIPDNPFVQPDCVDVDQPGATLGSLVGRAGPKFDQTGAPFDPFGPVKNIRDQIATEIDQNIPILIDGAVEELISQALEMSANRSVDGKPVCSVGYELDPFIKIDYTPRSP